MVVEDELGVEIELDQRSEGFQWLVSFFIVFFSEAEDKHANAILLLDEPELEPARPQAAGLQGDHLQARGGEPNHLHDALTISCGTERA